MFTQQMHPIMSCSCLTKVKLVLCGTNLVALEKALGVRFQVLGMLVDLRQAPYQAH
jgi:hypothetical protein